MTTQNFLALAQISGSRILASEIKATGTTIMEALVKLHEKVGPEVKVERTEIKRVEFLCGGFRVVSSVKGRSLRKYTEDRGSFISSLNIKVN